MRPYDRGESRASLRGLPGQLLICLRGHVPVPNGTCCSPEARTGGGRSPRGSLEQALDLRVEIPGDDESGVVPVGREKARHRGVELVLDLAPVVLVLPVARQLLQHLRLHALRRIGDEFRAGPACRGKATPQVGELLVGNVDLKGTDVRGGLDGRGHRGTSSRECGSSVAWRLRDLGIDRDFCASGACSASTFSTAFSRHVGQPPGRYGRGMSTRETIAR